MQTSRAQGMITLDNSIKQLVQEGAIAKDIALQYMQELSAHGTI